MAISQASAKTYTITLQGKVADDAEALARREKRTMSDLVGEALRAYTEAPPFKSFEEISDYAVTRNLNAYSEADVPRLVREVRDELAAEAPAKPVAARSR
jgi:hypothetical protein